MTYKLQYIQLWELQLLTAFMFKDKSNVSDTGLRLYNLDMALSEDTSTVDEYRELINAIKGIKIIEEKNENEENEVQGEPVFKVEPYTIPPKIKEETDKKKQEEMKELYMKRSRDCVVKLNISAEKLSSYLTEYIECYAQDYVGNLPDDRLYGTLLRKFRESINTDRCFKHYKMKEGKYLPVLLLGYFKGLIKFNSILTEFPEKMVSENVCIIEQIECNKEFYNVLKEDFWKTLYDVDISKFMNTSKEETRTNKKDIGNCVNEIINEVLKLKAEGEDKLYCRRLEQIAAYTISKNKVKGVGDVISDMVSSANKNYERRTKHRLLKRKVHDSSGDYYPIIL